MIRCVDGNRKAWLSGLSMLTKLMDVLPLGYNLRMVLDSVDVQVAGP